MRTLLVLSLLLIGCKESASTLSAVVDGSGCATVDIAATDIGESPSDEVLIDAGSFAVGNCIAYQGDYAWVQDSVDPIYHYAVNVTDGSIKEVDALVFDDAGCTSVVGELYTYPLHLSGDTFVFSFEGTLYEYTDVGAGNPWALAGAGYFIKTPGGSCDPYTVVDNTVRFSNISAFSRTFTGPVGL